MNFILQQRIEKRKEMIELNKATIISLTAIAEQLKGFEKVRVQGQIKRLQDDIIMLEHKNKIFSW